MSDITANIVVQPFNLGVTIEQPTLTIQPEPINLSVYAGGFAQAAGNNGTIQYNNGGVLGGIPSVFWTGTKLSLGDTNNITISGGSPNYALRTDGAGNLSWGDTANANYANFAGNAVYADNSGNANIANIANVAYSVSAANITGTIANSNYAAFAGNVTIAAQPNITSVGNLTSLRVVGTSNLGNIGNVKITGGNNGQYMQTDGTGNLFFVTGGGSGNGVVGGTDTQVQFNDGGLFGGNAGFVFNKTTGNLTVGTNIISNTLTSNSIAGTITTASQTNITSVGNLNALRVNGTTTIQQAQEKVLVNSTPANGTFNYSLLDQAIVLQSVNTTGNISLNFRGNSTITLDSIMISNQSMTCTFINQNGSVPYIVSNVAIDGTSQTVLYYNSNPPVIGSVNGKDFYTYNIIKTAANTYTVLGSSGTLG
jgi:hypothetical protein